MSDVEKGKHAIVDQESWKFLATDRISELSQHNQAYTT